jgi:hypothetical protein
MECSLWTGTSGEEMIGLAISGLFLADHLLAEYGTVLRKLSVHLRYDYEVA